MGNKHDHSCPDPNEELGSHTVCPCKHCFDTGYLDADPDEIECDCGASLQSDADMRAACEQIRAAREARRSKKPS
jgi:hypothetical protein